MKKINYIIYILLFILLGCNENELHSPCVDGECKIAINLFTFKDNKEYYHVFLNEKYSSYPIYIEASEIKPEFRYNNISVIEAWFDTDTYWKLDDSLMIKIPLYNSFMGLKSSPYWNSTPLPIGNKKIFLSQYKGMLVPIVQQNTRIYLSKYEENMLGFNSEYKPQENFLWSKRIIGPIPISMKGDTINIYTKIIWEAGNNTVQKIKDIKIIFE